MAAPQQAAGRSPWTLALLLGLVVLQLWAVPASASSGKRVLMLLPSTDAKNLYSTWLGALAGRGFEVDVKAVRDSSLKLKEHGAWLYDHLVLFTPKAEGFGGGIDASAITDFIDSGHNLIIAINSDISETMRTLVTEVGIDVDDKNTKVYDHFSYAHTEAFKADPTLVASSSVVDTPSIVPRALKGPVIFRGIAQLVPADSELVTVALSASPSAYSHDPRKPILEPPSLLVGQAISLVSLVQARNNARVMVSGSVELFSDAFANADVFVNGAWSKTGNAEFAADAALWALQDRGVLLASNLRHHLLGSEEQPSSYRVNDDVEFLLDIQERDGDSLKPYAADDVQVEFVMLDPYVRTALTHNGAGTFSVRFKVPDVYGVFKYLIAYRHRGYSYLDLSHQVPVRPFKHDEYPRFLVTAYPYYASALSTMLAFFAVGVFYLYHK